MVIYMVIFLIIAYIYSLIDVTSQISYIKQMISRYKGVITSLYIFIQKEFISERELGIRVKRAAIND